MLMTMLTKMISMMIMEIKKIVMTKFGESLNDQPGCNHIVMAPRIG